MKKEHILASLILALPLLQYTNLAFAKASFSRDAEESSPTKTDTKDRLEQIERRRQELHERARQVRQKERIALQQLKQIKNKLSVTTVVLQASQHKLKKTESKIN